jgi:hypothetical protein
MGRQKGVTLTGLLLVCAFLITVALIGFKLFPAYAQYLTIKKALQEISRNPEARSNPREVQAAFGRRAAIDNISAVDPKDLEISKQGDQVVIGASWSVKVPLLYNISACMDFEAKSTDP